MPSEPSGGVIDGDFRIQRMLDHLDNDLMPKALPLGFCYRRPAPLAPTHMIARRAAVRGDPPAYAHGAIIVRQGAILGGIRGKLEDRHTQRLGGGGRDLDGRAIERDAGAEKVAEVGELRTYSVADIHASPITLDKER